MKIDLLKVEFPKATHQDFKRNYPHQIVDTEKV